MFKFALILSIFYLTQIHAKTATEYIWIKNDSYLYDGNCFEIDSETKGKKYRAKVRHTYCEPENMLYYFLATEEKCIAIDSETKGKNFAYRTDMKNCRPKNTIKKFAQFRGTSGCYEIDQETEGKNYFHKVSTSECDSNKKSYLFKLEKNHKGNCYVQEGEQVIKVENAFCRPEKTSYRFYRETPFSGRCYEQDPRGEEFYSGPTAIKNCKPEKTIYIFYVDPNKTDGGKCYELDEKTKGDQYLDTVRDDDCKN